MTTQHAPQTPPMWRRFLSLPQTRLGWWAVGFAAIALVLIATSGFGEGFVIVDNGLVILAAVASFVYAIAVLAFVDRTVLVWAAALPGALVIVSLYVLLLFAISI